MLKCLHFVHLHAPLHFSIQPAPKPIKTRDTKAGWQYKSTTRLFKSDRHQLVGSVESLWILVRVIERPSAPISYITKRSLQTTDQYQGTVTRGWVHTAFEKDKRNKEPLEANQCTGKHHQLFVGLSKKVNNYTNMCWWTCFLYVYWEKYHPPCVLGKQ